MMTIDKGIVLNYLSTSRFILVCFRLSFKATSEAVDYNHQEQGFGKCGHRLTKTQCDAYAQSKVSSDSVAENDENKPQGCYKSSNEYKFNSNTANPDCSATDVCICKYGVGCSVSISFCS